MNLNHFYSILTRNFPFQPTTKQDIFFQQIAEFMTNNRKDEIFVLKGYAGTGKTTVIATIVNHLAENQQEICIARTNRSRGESDCELRSETSIHHS